MPDFRKLPPDIQQSEVLCLTPSALDGPDSIADPWPLPPSDPPIMIPGLNADGTLYPIEKIEAHVKGLHHLALSVFVFANDKLLIQRRALSKYHCGGQWANTCCTHPHFGEAPHDASLRRLQEELGFQVPVQERRVIDYAADVGGGLWERERVHMFRSDVSPNQVRLKLNPAEVCDTKWVTSKELQQDIRVNPARYTPWFRLYVEHYPDLVF